MSVENPHKIDTSKLDEIIQSYDCNFTKSTGSLPISP